MLRFPYPSTPITSKGHAHRQSALVRRGHVTAQWSVRLGTTEHWAEWSALSSAQYTEHTEHTEQPPYIYSSNESLTLIVFNLVFQSTPGYYCTRPIVSSICIGALLLSIIVPSICLVATLPTLPDTHSPRTNRRTQAHGTCTSLRSFTASCLTISRS